MPVSCKAKIVTEGHKTRLFLNDSEVMGLAGIDLSIHVGEEPTLTLEVRPSEIEVEVDGVVVERRADCKDNLLYLTGDIPAILRGLAKANKENDDA